VRSLNSRDRLFVTAGGGTRFGTNTQPPYDFLVGGLFRLTAYYPAELRAFDYAIGSLGYLRKVGRLPDFVGGGVYLGAWVEGGALWRDDGSYDNKGDLAIGALSETFFGPAMIGGAISGDGTGRLFLSLTPLFR
jgi:NTE family protein